MSASSLPTRTRGGAAAVAAVLVLPYAAIKVTWLAGGNLGLTAPTVMDTVTYRAANAVTLLLDLSIIALAAGLGSQRGLRLPAWSLLLPMWVACGLLASVSLIAGLTLLASPASGHRLLDGAIEPWVYTVVYACFAGQGAGLSVAFGLYAVTRWPGIIRASPMAIEHQGEPAIRWLSWIVLGSATLLGLVHADGVRG